MALRYTLFIVTILIVSSLLAVGVKAPTFDSLIFDLSNDPFAKLKKSYAKVIWKEAQKEKKYAVRFNMLKRVLDYDSSFKDVYKELCTFKSEYLKSEVELKEYLKLVREGSDKLEDLSLTDCYLDVLLSLSRYDEAIDYLKREQIQSPDEESGKAYLAKLKALQSDKNILDITKAVEKYYQTNKSYPGDILVLVNEGYLPFIPEEPYGGQYFISRQGQVRSTSEVENNER